ncbi:hypothetical protein LTR17_001842 [Elasticomyces elasticus]|nr:hypothetical protein LTR17_001842 [Elasticomyces elasticus]
MVRLSVVEMYFTRRKAAARWPSGGMLYDMTAKCFAVKHFDQSADLQALLERILAEAERNKTAKLEELSRLKIEYERLMKLFHDSEHRYIDVMVDGLKESEHTKADCPKCQYEIRADQLSIEVYEWPLPSAIAQQKVVVFELQPPRPFINWRDSLVYLLTNNLQATHAQELRPRALYPLSSDKKLTHYASGQTRRIRLLSEDKSHTGTHRKALLVSDALPDTICLPSGLNYRYHDATLGVFMCSAGFISTDKVPIACTYTLPKISEVLQSSLFRPSESPNGSTPNAIIASVSDCPNHMSLDEYKKLGSIPYGYNLQWSNILLQLAAPSVDFKKVETTMALLQCIYQAGPVGTRASSLRAGHQFCDDHDSGMALLHELQVALQRSMRNWECTQGLSAFISIAARLLTLSSSPDVHNSCVAFLEHARSTAFSWLEDLQNKAHRAQDQAERNQYLVKRAEVALICIDSFNIDDAELSAILTVSTVQPSVLIQCTIALQESRSLVSTAVANTTVKLLLLRSQRLLCRCYTMLALNIPALDDAISKSWTGFRRSTTWVPAPCDHWLSTTSTTGSKDLRVHFNLLSGELLVNGLPLDRLPLRYEAFESYRTLFGRLTIEVMPTLVQGLRFASKRTFAGYEVHFGMSTLAGTNELLLQATKGGQRYELLPKALFSNVFPAAFVENYVHWYRTSDKSVEFRPVDDPWNELSSKLWSLTHDQTSERWQLTHLNTRQILLSLPTATSKALTLLLLPLADANSIHITYQPQAQSVPRELEVDIPDLQLGFRLRAAQCSLRSKEFPDMYLDSNQCLGCLVGLENRLLLRNARGSRTLLILDGRVLHDSQRTHVGVSIQKASPGTSGKFHTFRVDETLGRLTGHGLQSKLLLAYLHALTSHCLPDPLTRTTGTEQGLAILRSAEIRSFDRLADDSVRLLQQIAALTPVRVHYPIHERVMQTIHWSSKLGFSAQHFSFRTEVQSIFDQAQRTSVLYSGANPLPELPKSNDDLVQRGAIREASFHVSGFGAEDFTTLHDMKHEPRDQSQTSSMFSNTFVFSTFVYQRKQDLHWAMPADIAFYLWNAMASTPTIPGPQTTTYGKLEYDATLLASAFQETVFPVWMGLMRELRTRANTFDLMMWLSTLACSSTNGPYTSLLQILALTFSRPDLAQIVLPPPPCDAFRPPAGKIVQQGEIRQLVTASLRPLSNTPLGNMPQEPYENKQTWTNRRKQRYDNTTYPIVNAIVQRLVEQWPCRCPQVPDLSDVNDAHNYIDIGKVMEGAKPKFKTWYDNLQFYHYLERIGRAVSALSLSPVQVSSATISYPNAPVRKKECITEQDLFSVQAPNISQVETDGIGRDWIDVRDDVGGSSLHLNVLVAAMKSSAGQSKYESGYVDDFEKSALQLRAVRNDYSIMRHDGLEADLDSHLQATTNQVDMMYKTLLSAVSPGSNAGFDRAAALWSMKHWPRVSPIFFLQQLSHLRWSSLDAAWRDALVQYGLALTALQRAERLIKAASSGSDLDLINELRNAGHVNWDPQHYPDSLLLEVDSGVMIREVQEEIAEQMRDSEHNAVMQLNMGEGKSSLIVPIVAAALANGSRLVRVVVAKPQSKQMAQMMISKLGGMLNRRVYYLPFSRALKMTPEIASSIRGMLQECMSVRSILLVQPEHILSFKLMALELDILGNYSVGRALLDVQDFFDKSSRDLVDESDENFSVKFELIYTIGTPRLVELSTNRWQCIHEILGLVRKFGQATTDRLPGSLEFTHALPGRFPRTRILKPDAQDDLFSTIAEHVCKTGLKGFPIARQGRAVREAVYKYITKVNLTPHEIDCIQHDGPGSLWIDSTKGILLLLRGLFAAGVLSFVFSQKRWRVNYGLDSTRTPPTKLAVPYRAKDMPSPRAEFSHPDVIITLTSLSYYYGGLSEVDLAAAFDHLSRSDQAVSEYSLWVKDADNLPNAFIQLEGINLRDKQQFSKELFPRLCNGKAIIDYFLANIVFPKEMREFPQKLSASGWDIGKQKTLPTTGFSGTNDSRTVLPLHVQQKDLAGQKHTNALVLDYLLQASNDVAEMPVSPQTDPIVPDAECLLNMVMTLNPPARVILDVGAQILEMSNIQVAKHWLALSDASVQAVVFFDSHDELSVVNRQGRVEPLQTSSFGTQLDVCLVFLDESHTRGTDLRLPESYRAAVTLGAGLTKDRMTQACMRMRKLGKGQTVVFCVPAEIKARISACTGKPLDARIDVADIIHWTVSETWIDMRRSMPLWAAQGVRFVRQNALWEKAQGSDGRTSLSPQQAKGFLEDEAQSLEDRYRPSADAADSMFTEYSHIDVDRIKQRCREFGNLSFTSTTLQEEQERELSPEKERERQVEKLPSALPRAHSLHPDIVQFVSTGVLSPGSRACQPAFATLSSTTAADANIDLTEMSEGSDRDVLVTEDFARTIDTRALAASHMDSYQRPVQWVLTAVQDGQVVKMLIISPFEAQNLYPQVQSSSKVALHVYSPRTHSTNRSFDRLDFYTVPHQLESPTAHPRLIAQLNIFSGQLYVNNYQDFTQLCTYLGLAIETAAEGWEVAADGFIVKNAQGEVGGAGSRLTKSPVKFLQMLMTMRRDGEGISKTHMGTLLGGKLLQAEDFGQS